MSQIAYVKGDVIAVALDIALKHGQVYLPHIVNDANGMGSGVALALLKKWPSVKKMYHEWYNLFPRHFSELKISNSDFQVRETGPFKLGQCQFVEVTDDITVVNMIGQSTPGGEVFTIEKNKVEYPPVRYQSTEECMYRVLQEMQKRKVSRICTIKFCCGLAGGSYDIIEPLIQNVWINNGIKVTVVEP